MSEDPRPGTTAAVERRIEKLEVRMDAFVTDLADLRSEVRIGNAATASVNLSIQALSAKVDVITAQQQLAAAQSAAEAKAREHQSISNARLFGMAAAAATIAGVVFSIAVSVVRG